MEPRLRLGVVGCGAIATSVHLPVLRRLSEVRVTAVADPVRAARERAARLVPGAAALASADELVTRPDVDAVVVCSPSGAHAEHALLVLSARRHLYLEKPLAIDLVHGARVVEAARAAGVVAAIGFNWRYQPLVERARELVRSGTIGDVREAKTIFCEPRSPADWKRRRETGGGVLLDLGSHHVDLLRWLLDVEVEGAEATIGSNESEHDEADLLLALSGGRTARSFFSFRDGAVDRVELFGTKGVLRVDRYRRSLSLDPPRTVLTRKLAGWRLRTIVRPGSEPSWRHALRAWIAAVHGADVELPTLADGLKSLQAIVAAEQAAGA